VDASHFVHGAFVCCLWCFVRLFVRSPSGRKRWNVLGAVDFVTKQLVTVTNTTYITATTVCELLRVLAAQHPGVPITLVLDNARYQKCALVQDLAKQLQIEMLYLPAYSPNLNLIERLWKYVKKQCLNGKYYATFAEFQAAIQNCLTRINTDYRDDMKTLLTRNFQLFDNRTFLAA
jgi:transposase